MDVLMHLGLPQLPLPAVVDVVAVTHLGVITNPAGSTAPYGRTKPLWYMDAAWCVVELSNHEDTGTGR